VASSSVWYDARKRAWGVSGPRKGTFPPLVHSRLTIFFQPVYADDGRANSSLAPRFIRAWRKGYPDIVKLLLAHGHVISGDARR
jgi:hypothetical protein